MARTTLPVITETGFGDRAVANFPIPWAAEESRAIPGVLRAVFEGGAVGLEQMLAELTYALGGARLDTSTGDQVDTYAADFFGPGGLPRAPGESDSSYVQRIIASLFPSAATRQALSDAIFAITHIRPRMLEPWNPGDTGCWDYRSFWDVDTARNPARWGDGGQRYQGFIDTTVPASNLTGGHPYLTFDDGAFWDVPGYADLIIKISGRSQLLDVINQKRFFGGIVWVKFVPASTLEVTWDSGLLWDDPNIVWGP